jgi:hypothetical protein
VLGLACRLKSLDKVRRLTDVDHSIVGPVVNQNGWQLREIALKRRSDRRTKEVDDALQTGGTKRPQRQAQCQNGICRGRLDNIDLARIVPAVSSLLTSYRQSRANQGSKWSPWTSANLNHLPTSCNFDFIRCTW